MTIGRYGTKEEKEIQMKDGKAAGTLEKKETLRNIENGTTQRTNSRTEIMITAPVETGGPKVEITRIGTTSTLRWENVTTTRARVAEEMLTPDVKRHGTQKKIIVPLTK